MLRTIKLGEKPVDMKGAASTDIYYKNVFGIDPIRETASPNFGPGDLIAQMIRMAYVMAMQAKLDREEMGKLNPDTFLDWLDEFDRSDIFEHIGEIRALYEGQKAPTSVQKKTGGKQSVSTI